MTSNPVSVASQVNFPLHLIPEQPVLMLLTCDLVMVPLQIFHYVRGKIINDFYESLLLHTHPKLNKKLLCGRSLSWTVFGSSLPVQPTRFSYSLHPNFSSLKESRRVWPARLASNNHRNTKKQKPHSDQTEFKGVVQVGHF